MSSGPAKGISRTHLQAASTLRTQETETADRPSDRWFLFARIALKNGKGFANFSENANIHLFFLKSLLPSARYDVKNRRMGRQAWPLAISPEAGRLGAISATPPLGRPIASLPQI